MAVSVVPHPDVVARRLADNIVLVHLNTNRIFTLNRTGSRIWELLVAGRSPEEIEEALPGEFQVGREQVEHELGPLLDRLLSEGLVVQRDSMAP